MTVPALDWRPVSGGPFPMGSDPGAAHPPDPDEAPRHEVAVAPFRLGRTAVTNAHYRRFVEATGHRAPGTWPHGRLPEGQEDVPVTYVSWHDAVAFCRWARGRLPTESEWEAAAGGDGRLWPWGDAPPTAARAVFDRGIGGPEPAGTRPAGAAPCGALDLAGNVAEWVSSAYRHYPYDPADGREDPSSAEPRVVRGGSYLHHAGAVRSSSRLAYLPGAIDTYVGFRVAADRGGRCDAVELVDVPGGPVSIGREPVAFGGPALPDEAPQTAVDLPAFELSRAPVTNAQYAAFARATGHRAPVHWSSGGPPTELAQHPVTYVSWHDAAAFCAWAGGRLPTEAEWEKAARGTDARLYPWGGEPPDGEPPDDAHFVVNHHKVRSRAAFGRGAKGGGTVTVGSFPDGASPYGLLDMAGNVWEWVSSAYRPYPHDPGDGREDPASPEERVLRGGSYASPGDGREDPASPEERVLRGGSYASPSSHLRCAARSRSYPTRLAPHIGFRVARSL